MDLETTDSPASLPEPQLVDIMETQFDNITEKALDDKEEFFDGGKEETDGFGTSTSVALPVEADMVLAYATVPGEYIYSDNNNYMN